MTAAQIDRLISALRQIDYSLAAIFCVLAVIASACVITCAKA